MPAILKEKPLQAEGGTEPHAPPKEAHSKQRPVYITEGVSSLQGFKNFVRYKFSADQLYGTLFLLLNAYTQVQAFGAGKNRQGKKEGTEGNNLSALENKKNRQMMIGAFVQMAFIVWSFLSSRSGVPPDGNSYGARILDSIKHPERSQQQLSYFLATFNNAVYEWGNIKYGFTKAAMPEEKASKRVQAVLCPLTVGLGFTDLFEDKQKRAAKLKAKEQVSSSKTAEFKTSKSRIEQSKWLYPVRVIRHTYRTNPKRIFSMMLSIIMPLATLQEGVSKRHSMNKLFKNALKEGSQDWLDAQKTLRNANKPVSDAAVREVINEQRPEKMAESTRLLKKSSMSVFMSFANTFYALDQLYKGEQLKAQQASVSAASPFQEAERVREFAKSSQSR